MQRRSTAQLHICIHKYSSVYIYSIHRHRIGLVMMQRRSTAQLHICIHIYLSVYIYSIHRHRIGLVMMQRGLTAQLSAVRVGWVGMYLYTYIYVYIHIHTHIPNWIGEDANRRPTAQLPIYQLFVWVAGHIYIHIYIPVYMYPYTNTE